MWFIEEVQKVAVQRVFICCLSPLKPSASAMDMAQIFQFLADDSIFCLKFTMFAVPGSLARRRKDLIIGTFLSANLC